MHLSITLRRGVVKGPFKRTFAKLIHGILPQVIKTSMVNFTSRYPNYENGFIFNFDFIIFLLRTVMHAIDLRVVISIFSKSKGMILVLLLGWNIK